MQQNVLSQTETIHLKMHRCLSKTAESMTHSKNSYLRFVSVVVAVGLNTKTEEKLKWK
jgi:hypothetical protein